MTFKRFCLSLLDAVPDVREAVSETAKSYTQQTDSMKRLSIQVLPSEISEDILLILTEMANEIPPSKEWNAVFGHLSIIDLQRVMNKKLSSSN